jgi:hypothetical protein
MNSSNTEWAWPWWTVIVLINVVNLVACAVVYRRSLIPRDGSDAAYRKQMRMMGVIFALVAAYRAVFVSRYTAQLAWFDTVANSSLLVRMFAVAAELSFSGLFALALLRVNSDIPAANDAHANKFKLFITKKSPYVLFVCIFLAQFFATSGLISKNQTLFAIEETLWTVGFLAVLPLAILQLRRVYAIKDEETVARLHMLRQSTIIIAAWCVFYCSYGLFYHLPLETWAGAINQIETGLPVIKSGASAITDAFLIVNETKAYGDWGFGFLLWHSAYFSVCVWISIFLMRAPRSMRRELETASDDPQFHIVA